jgi:hypothetical protein
MVLPSGPTWDCLLVWEGSHGDRCGVRERTNAEWGGPNFPGAGGSKFEEEDQVQPGREPPDIPRRLQDFGPSSFEVRTLQGFQPGYGHHGVGC